MAKSPVNGEVVKKSNAVTIAKKMLPQVPFNTVYSYADNLFDLSELGLEDQSIDVQINFLKQTKLCDVEFEDTDSGSFFKIKHRTTGESIDVSNRESSRGELRGAILRERIEVETKVDPNQTLYLVISNAVKSPKYSDMVVMFKGLFIGNAARELYGTVMPNEHLDLYVAVLISKIKERIASGHISSDLEPGRIRHDVALQNKIWEGIDVESIYDATSQFNSLLQQIKNKAIELEGRGYLAASNAANTLYNNLVRERNEFTTWQTNGNTFANNCAALITAARDGELNRHRGFFGIVFNALLKVLNTVTFGLVEVKPTDAIRKSQQVKGFLDTIMREERVRKVEQPEDEMARAFAMSSA